MLYGSLDGKAVRGRMASPFTGPLKLSQHCLLIGYIPIQNQKLKK